LGNPGNDAALLVDANSCQPGDVPAVPPTAYVHAAAPRDACRPGAGGDPTTAIYDTCFGPLASATACQTLVSGPAIAGCWQCIETSMRAGAYGPVLTDSEGFIAPNVAGCIELEDPTALGCAKSLQAKAQCDQTACEANCPLSGAPLSASLAAYEECTDHADLGGCMKFAQAVATACVSVDPTAMAICNPNASSVVAGETPFFAFYKSAVVLFCETSGSGSSSSSSASSTGTYSTSGSSSGSSTSRDAGSSDAGSSDAASSDAGIGEDGAISDGGANEDAPAAADGGASEDARPAPLDAPYAGD
jgi:hypothetical protein